MSFVDTDSVLFDGSGADTTLKQMNSAVSLGKAMASGDAPNVANQAVNILEKEKPEVQQLLAFELRLVADLPELVVTTIAKSDDPSVSMPFLEVSPAVTEELILSIVDELNGSAQTAVARRSDVTDAVADALVERGNEKVALTLARNDKVEISQEVLERIVAKFPNDARILKSAKNALLRVKEAAPAQASATALPFNVLMSRARAFQKNGMLSGEYLVKLLGDKALNEFEAALCVLSDKPRKEVRAMAMQSNETRIDLEQLCTLAPGTLSGNAEVLMQCYAAARSPAK